MASSTEFFWRRDGSKGASRSTGDDVSSAIEHAVRLFWTRYLTHVRCCQNSCRPATPGNYNKHVNRKLQRLRGAPMMKTYSFLIELTTARVKGEQEGVAEDIVE